MVCECVSSTFYDTDKSETDECVGMEDVEKLYINHSLALVFFYCAVGR